MKHSLRNPISFPSDTKATREQVYHTILNLKLKLAIAGNGLLKKTYEKTKIFSVQAISIPFKKLSNNGEENVPDNRND